MTFRGAENLISVRVRAITPAGTGSWSPIASEPVKCECFCFFLFIISGLYLLFFKNVCFLMIAIIYYSCLDSLDTIAKTIFLQAETEKQERRDDGTLNDSR